MTSKLSEFSEDDLRAELDRRKNHNEAGSDFYFFICSWDGSSDAPEDQMFAIVHKRFWHLRHCVCDHHIGKHLIVPDGFSEALESFFNFSGDNEKGIQLLESFGYIRLDPAPDFWSALLVVFVTMNGLRIRVNMICDTDKIKARIQKAHSDSLEFDSLASYVRWIRSLGDFVCVSRDSGSNSVAVLEGKIYDGLPDYPEWM